MRAVLWICRIVVVVALLAFALENTEPVSVRFVFDTLWQAPQIVVLLSFFAAGVVFGMLSLLGTLFRQRKEISRLRRELKPSLPPATAAAEPLHHD